MSTSLHRGRAAAVAAAILIGSMGAAAAQDAFAQACVARGKSTAQKCACQAKLARASFTAPEQAAMIRALNGDQPGFKAAIAAMGDQRRKAFVSKMQALRARSDKECR